MNALFGLAAEVQSFCKSRQWRFCFIGGIALQRWGEPRLTRDVGLTIVTGFGGEDVFVDALSGAFRQRVPHAREFALRNRVLLLQSPRGIPIDVSLGGLAFEERVAERSSGFAFLPGVTLRTCSSEDLVVLKAFADRARDWADIEGILARTVVEWNTVRDELEPLCEAKEAPHILPRLLALGDSTRHG